MNFKAIGCLVVLTLFMTVGNGGLAAGAWVLWVQVHRISYPRDSAGHDLDAIERVDWEVLGAASSEKQCGQKLREKIYEVTHPPFPAEDTRMLYKVTGDSVSVLFYPKASKDTDKTMIAQQLLSYVCLPDTVDPRAAKGAK